MTTLAFNDAPRGPRAVVFDTETHSNVEQRIIEAAYGYVDEQDEAPVLTEVFCQRYNPGVPIRTGAILTHGILDEELADCPPSESFVLPEDVGYAIGHNVEFDLQAAGNPPGVLPIDTLSLSRILWPDADSHKQGALLYTLHDELGLTRPQVRDLVKNAHGAAADIGMCAQLYGVILRHVRPVLADLEDMTGRQYGILPGLHLLSLAPKLPLKMTFGKHEGMPAKSVPWSYKDWYINKAENNDPWVVMAMTEGGNSPESKACYEKLAPIAEMLAARQADPGQAEQHNWQAPLFKPA